MQSYGLTSQTETNSFRAQNLQHGFVSRMFCLTLYSVQANIITLLQMVKKLLDSGADPHVCDLDGQLPAQYALLSGHQKVICHA